MTGQLLLGLLELAEGFFATIEQRHQFPIGAEHVQREQGDNGHENDDDVGTSHWTSWAAGKKNQSYLINRQSGRWLSIHLPLQSLR